MPHAALHTVLVPYVTAFHLPTAPAAEQALRRALATDAYRSTWREHQAELGAPRSLAELGLDDGDLGGAVAQALAHPYTNPRPVTAKALRALLVDARRGTLAP
ncbi:iron-containing alcohol dehydrogenase [Streptomyces stelliscabiei]|uniref:iron-containing alcohol dehydrogenase n=1 Tax=Streptomyces stelliscabiei TaxID=146820 RepID=UPI002FF41C64